MSYLKRLFTAPTFEDEIKTQQAYILHVIVWTLICVPIPFVIYSFFRTPEDIIRTFIQAGFGETVNIILLIMLRRGLVKAASIIQVGAFWFFFTATALTGSGVRGEAYLLGYGLVIAIAGILLGGIGALTFTILSLAMGGLMVSREMQGIFAPVLETSPLTTWIVSLVLFPVGAVLQHLAAHTVSDSLTRAHASEEKYRLISRVSSDYTFSTEVVSAGVMRLSWVAGAFEEITGYTYDEYIASGGWLARLHPDDLEKDAQDMSALRKGQPVLSEVRTYRKDGSLRWVQVSAHPVWDDKQNRMSGIVGAVKDITERKQAEEALRKSEAIYRQAIEVSGGVPYHQTYLDNGEVIYDFVGEGIHQITGGYGPEEFNERLWDSLVQERLLLDDLAGYSLDDAIQRVRSGESSIWKCEHRIKARDGKIHWVLEVAVELRDENGVSHGSIGLFQDITERKQAEETLRESEAIYRQAIEVAGAVPYYQTFDHNGRIIYEFMGEGIRQITGYGPEEFNDDLWGSLTQERHLLEDLAPYSLDEAIQRVRSNKNPIWKCEHRIKARDGKIHWVFEAAVDLRDEHGVAYGSVGLYQDITEQKRSDEALRYERDLLQIFMDNIPDTVYFKDTESRFLRINKTQAQLLKLNNPLEAIGKTDLDFQHPDLARQFMEEEKQIVKTGQSIINRIEFNPTADGQPRWLSATKVPVKDSAERMIGIIGISRDITEQKRAEEAEQRRRSMLEKIIKLGQFVAEVQDLRTTLQRIWQSIRHDLNFDRLGIYLYDAEHNAMDGTYGTNMQGEMVGEWNSHISLDDEAIEIVSFIDVLQNTNGLYITRDYETEHNISTGHIMSGVKDYAAVAARTGDKPVAVICVDNLISKRPIMGEQLEALRLFAGYAGLAIENARLNDALAKELDLQKEAEHREAHRRQMLEKVVLLGKQVTEVSDLKTTLEKVWRGVHNELGFDRLAIFLYDQESHSIKGTLGTNNQGEIVEEWDYSRSLRTEKPTSFTHALEQPDGVYLTHNFAAEFNIPEGHEMRDVKDFAAVTAWGGDKPVAIITVDNFPSQQPITKEQLEALRLFAGYAGLAIENARLKTALEDDLYHRAILIEELETKNAELERFTYTVSHDLKSPLVTITGFLGYIEKDALAGNIERVKNNINRISNAARKMQALLNDLLELSRIGRLMNSPEDVPFEEIVNEAVDRVRGRLDEIDAIVEIQRNLPVVNGDRVRLVEVVQNLIDNAAKYSNPTSIPRIEIGTLADRQNPIVFYIRDNGIGIASQYHENIFGLFNKLNATSEGTGIGLALVKRIVEVHGGHIWVESEAGKGATFYFTLQSKQIKE